METSGAEGVLGINGLGRIGKLTLLHEAGNQRFKRLVVNTGREVGKGGPSSGTGRSASAS